MPPLNNNNGRVRPRRSSPTAKLPKREVGICLRLKLARERLGLNQEKFAKRAGITRGGLGNYELCRTPLRYDLALRVCRTFIISEEWLATGEFAAVHQAAPQFHLDTPEGKARLGEMFYRQCMDLASEEVAHRIPRSTLFSVAYDDFLAPVYARLVQENFPDPRLKRSLLGDPEVSVNLLNVYVQRWLMFLGRVAPFSGLEQQEVQNEFLTNLLQAGDTIHRGYLGVKRPDFHTPTYDYLRKLLESDSAQIGPLNPPPPDE